MSKRVRRFETRYKYTTVSEPIEKYLGDVTSSPERAAVLCQFLLEDETQEVVIALWLDVRNKLIGYSEIARGGLDTCEIDNRVLFREALLAGAAAAIVSHNHPSGDATPSNSDYKITSRIKRAGELLGIRILDHIVVGDGKWVSISREGGLR